MTNTEDSKIRAFGGGPLLGSDAVRYVHVDEAGISRREPYAVVAGIVTHADKQWRALNQYLSDMADDLVPNEYREGLIFHAKDLFHGSGKFDREKWPRQKRMAIMEQLALIPSKFDIPVVSGIVEKKKHQWSDSTASEMDANHYALAFGLCATSAEYFMRNFAEPDEVATLIAEDVPHMRKHAQWGYKVLKNPSLGWDKGSDALASCAPLTRIVEQPMFAAKDQSSILQVADLLAFALCRRANGKNDVSELIKLFFPHIIMLPHWLGDEIKS